MLNDEGMRNRFTQIDNHGHVRHSMSLVDNFVALNAMSTAAIANGSEVDVRAEDILAYEETDDLDTWRERTCEHICRMRQCVVEEIGEVGTERVRCVLEVKITEKDSQVAQGC